jgi:hypothetical protein
MLQDVFGTLDFVFVSNLAVIKFPVAWRGIQTSFILDF